MDVEEVHFHEVGAVDSVVDIVAACAAMEYLDCSSVQISPLPMGRGRARRRTGASSPPPAVLSCLCGSGLETFDAGADGEFVTPTGACIVAALGTAGRSARWPAAFAPLRTAYGAGRNRGATGPTCCGLCSARFRARRPPGARATKAKEGTWA